jgi:glycosyltransferase involved in cell wall biosynthesis
VEQVPTVVDLRKYTPRAAFSSGDAVTIGWIGSPATAKYLETLAGPLAQVCRETNARVRLIGAGPTALSGVPVDRLAWDEATETKNISEFDMGIMPLPDGPWERGKCGFKLIQYMACGVSVVASPVGMNRRIVEPGVHGFLASSEQQWVETLTQLIRDPALRARLGAEGRRRIEDSYSTQVVAPRLARLLRQAAGAGPEQVTNKCAESQAS